MSGVDRMRALTNGHMASAETVAQLGTGSNARTAGTGGRTENRAPGEYPELISKDTLA